MAGKILEIIKKTSDFNKNEMTVLCRDTSFGGVGKKVSTEPGQTLLNVAPSQKVGYQLFQDIRSRQDVMYQRFLNLTNAYNSWLANVVWNRYGRGGASEYPQYIIPAPPNHVVNEGDSADFNLLSEVINLDQASLYGSYHDLTLERFPDTLSKLKEWSKGRIYGSNVTEMISAEFETSSSQSWWDNGTWYGAGGGVNIRWSTLSSTDKNRMIATGLENMAVGETRAFLYENPAGPAFIQCRWTIKRTSLGSTLDDGYTHHVSHSISGSWGDRINGSHYYGALKGVQSPHFDGDAKYNFLSSRNINI